jgi:anthranilate phosphoribosyltransferase
MDEISPLGVTHVRELRGDAPIKDWTIDPAQFGYRNLRAADLGGGEPAENAEIVRAVLRGAGSEAAQAAVVMNAAAALYVQRGGADYGALIAETKRALTDGSALRTLDTLIAASAAG